MYITPRRSHEEIEKCNKPITNETESVIKNLPKKIPGSDSFTDNWDTCETEIFYQHLNKINTHPSQTPPKVEKHFQTFSMKPPLPQCKNQRRNYHKRKG